MLVTTQFIPEAAGCMCVTDHLRKVLTSYQTVQNWCSKTSVLFPDMTAELLQRFSLAKVQPTTSGQPPASLHVHTAADKRFLHLTIPPGM